MAVGVVRRLDSGRPHHLKVEARRPAAHRNTTGVAMRACTKFAAACLLGALGLMPRAAAAADLVILTNQGATPGVRELAAAFERASGHKVSVIQVEGEALEQRINGGAADLVTANPPAIEDLVQKGKVVAGTVTPFVV